MPQVDIICDSKFWDFFGFTFVLKKQPKIPFFVVRILVDSDVALLLGLRKDQAIPEIQLLDILEDNSFVLSVVFREDSRHPKDVTLALIVTITMPKAFSVDIRQVE